ncbi:MAG: phospholipase D-like domain-containing protein [Treponema sp.]|nr:phospholipase D-like domain-containing protein [Spirochaetia bacterium]MDY4902939.1 phospholipase D-like domain-containing protein [Treponema sp.]
MTKKKLTTDKDFRHPLKYTRFLKPLAYSKLLFISLLLFVQFSIYIMLVLKFRNFTRYIGEINLALSVLFLTYLANCPGKNEFKLVWILPVLVLPFFGIPLYFSCKGNFGGRNLKKNLNIVKKLSEPILREKPQETAAVFKQYPKVSDISKYLLETSACPPYIDTKATYFSSGETAFPDIKEHLKKAEKFIFIEYFIIEPSTIWFEIQSILHDKAKQGVDVRILYDSLGSGAYSTIRYERYLAKKGIKSKVFMPFIPVFDTGLNNRDHRKILVIDGKTVYTGGINISDEYANIDHSRFDYWKDTAIRLDGPAVRSYTIMFLQMWNIANKKMHDDSEYRKFADVPCEKFPNQGVAIPYNDDAYNGEDIAENVYSYILAKSHSYVHITTPYLILDNNLISSLSFAAKRGVDVSLIVPKHYDHYITFCVGKIFQKTLIENGVRIFEYNPGFIHAKSFVADGNRGATGSINLDYRSLFHHFECGVFLYCSPEIARIEEDFQNTLKDCTEVTMEIYKKTPLVTRIIGWIFKIFAPLL